MARVTPSPVGPPSSAETLAGLPMYGRIMGRLSDALVQQVAARGLQRTTFLVSPTDCASGPASMSFRMLHRVSAMASGYLWVGFSYQADEAFTFAPVVTVSAYVPGGAVIDPAAGSPATWSWATGTLTVSPPSGGLVVAGRMLSRDAWQSSERVVSAGLARPRLLDVSGYQGQDVEIRVATTSTRIWDMVVADDWSEEV